MLGNPSEICLHLGKFQFPWLNYRATLLTEIHNLSRGWSYTPYPAFSPRFSGRPYIHFPQTSKTTTLPCGPQGAFPFKNSSAESTVGNQMIPCFSSR